VIHALPEPVGAPLLALGLLALGLLALFRRRVS
jgi:MYXO-CTERM domain-containing protein